MLHIHIKVQWNNEHLRTLVLKHEGWSGKRLWWDRPYPFPWTNDEGFTRGGCPFRSGANPPSVSRWWEREETVGPSLPPNSVEQNTPTFRSQRSTGNDHSHRHVDKDTTIRPRHMNNRFSNDRFKLTERFDEERTRKPIFLDRKDPPKGPNKGNRRGGRGSDSITPFFFWVP